MSPIIIRPTGGGRRGFTLAEVLIASIIGTLVIVAAWSVYVMVWQWWAESSPRLDVERSARIALLRVVEGVPGSATGDTGKDTVNSIDYKRRNGIAWSTDNPEFESVTIDGQSKVRKIKFRLKLDDEKAQLQGNIRSYYLAKNGDQRVIYYRYYNYDTSSYATEEIANSPGVIYDVEFASFTDDGSPPASYPNIVTVKLSAAKEVYGTRVNQPFTVRVDYTDTVYLRNKLD